MATQCEPGRFLARVEDQRFSDIPDGVKFFLDIRVLQSLDHPDVPCKAYLREVSWWITDKNLPSVLHVFETLGYEGSTLSGLDPDTEGFHDFRGKEVPVICSHEEDKKGNLWERWCLAKQTMKDKSKLCELDRLLTQTKNRANGSAAEDTNPGITDADIPF